MSRYKRQISVPTFGSSGHDRFRAARILVIGAGGLAAPLLQYLTGAGLGHIRLVDDDKVELSNLHRQTLFREEDIGKAKVMAAADQLVKLNSETDFETIQARFGPENAASLCANVDLIVECTDEMAASYIASDYCMATGQPLISASVSGTQGYCGGFCGGAPGLRAVFPHLPEQLGSCETEGVLGPAVGVIGSLQAQLVMAQLVGMKPTPLGQLVTFDAQTMRFSGFRFDQAENPEPNPPFIARESLEPNDFIVDLRAEGEGGPRLADAHRHQVTEFAPGGPTPSKGQRAVLACRSGLRSWHAAERLSTYWNGKIALLALGNN